MPAPNPIHAIGTILECTGPRVYRTALPNGKEILAHVPFKLVTGLGLLAPRTKVKLELTAYDFSTGRIAGKAEES